MSDNCVMRWQNFFLTKDTIYYMIKKKLVYGKEGKEKYAHGGRKSEIFKNM